MEADVQVHHRTQIKVWLIRLAALGPIAYLVADRIGHLFGICLGH